MRISFDLDDTLICDARTPTEQHLSWWKRWRYPELMRQCSRDLLRELARDHEIWIYTTSYRSPRQLRSWFASIGVRIFGVVNQTRHEKVIGRRGPSKHPSVFDIDLHVDDFIGVAEVGRLHGFNVFVVSPTDLEWVAKVRAACQPLHCQRTGRSTDERTDLVE